MPRRYHASMAIDPAQTAASVPIELARDHDRHWHAFDYVYPVISRRSGGLSVGVNLNPDGACNFDCVYCQVDRTRPPARRDVDLGKLRDELDRMIGYVTSGTLWRDKRFAVTPDPLRRFADIAFSGDGEPTACPVFPQACDLVVELREKHRLADTRIVLITNATRLDKPTVQQAIDKLHRHGGEVWAKLDAGTQAWFEQLDRPRGGLTLDGVTQQIITQSQRHPLVIQSMFLQIDGKPPPESELAAYRDRLAGMLEAGARITGVQLYTLARPPAETNLSALPSDQMDALAQRVREAVDNVPVRVFYAPK